MPEYPCRRWVPALISVWEPLEVSRDPSERVAESSEDTRDTTTPEVLTTTSLFGFRSVGTSFP